MKKKLLSEIYQFSFCICLVVGFSNNAFAQAQLGIYTFKTATNNCASPSLAATAAIPATLATFSNFSQNGAITCLASGSEYAATNWPTTAPVSTTTTYYEFTFTPAAGARASLTQLVFKARRNVATVINYYVRTSADGYNANIMGPTQAPNQVAPGAVQSTVLSFCNLSSSITFRIYASSASAAVPLILDDIALWGVATPAPNAGSAQTLCSGTPSLTLTANAISLANSFPNPGGLGTWSVFSGPSTLVTQFGNVNTNNTTFTPAGGTGTYTLRWTATHSGAVCHSSFSSVLITVSAFTTSPQLRIYAMDYLGNVIGDSTNMNPTICELQTIDFYVFSPPFINPVPTPNTFIWKKNGAPVLTQNNISNPGALTWQTSNLATGDVITLTVTWPTPTTSPVVCYSPSTRVSQSLTFSVTPNQPPVVAISHNFPTDTICRGNQVTFTAAAFNAGSPSYTWYLDGAPVGNAITYTTLATLAAGNHNVWCEIVSNESCDLMDTAYTQWTASAPIALVVNPCYYYVPVSGTLGPFYSCGSPFYDSALDLPVNYSNNANGMVKLCPAVANQYVTISFTSIFLNDAGDRLRIFSGTPASTFTADTSAVPLFNLAGPTSSAGCGSVVTSNVSGGCLTAHFKSDGLGNLAGWVSNLTCSPTPSPGPLQGSTCANATVISALPYSITSHTTQCYGADYTSQTGICNTSYSGEDRVYQYTATGPECTSITLSGTSGTPTLAVYSGCPGSVGTVCLTPIPQSGNSVAQVTFPSAGTYYIIVDEAGAPTAFSTYNLNIQSFGLAPANDLPCNAQYIDLLVSVNGNT